MSSYAGIDTLMDSCDSTTKIQVHTYFSRHFFYPNVCYICHRHDSEFPLKKCGNCKMIYYCSREHQKVHWPLHKKFCEKIGILKYVVKNPAIYPDQDKFNTGQINTKANLIYLTELKMNRKLDPYENEIIEYPKVCEVCLEENPNLLKACPRCPQANFCKHHEGDSAHEQFCSLYNSCFLLDYYAIVFQELPIPRMMEFVPRDNSETVNMPNSMQEYLDIFFKPRQGSKFDFPPEDVKMYISQHFTRPLTLIYAMKKIDFKPRSNKMIIHVIGASKREEKSLIEWEILFHWLPQLMHLKVVLVGPELSDNNPSLKEKESSLCEGCAGKGKSVKIQIHNILYINYCDGENFERPDVIIGFNLGIVAYPSWEDSILEVSKLSCPFVLTAFSEREANDDHKMMQKKFNTSAKVEKNPFASLRPKRSPIGDKVFYENQFVIVYTDLDLNNHKLVEKEEIEGV